MTDLLVVLSHPDTLASGRPIAPGDEIPDTALDPGDLHDARLITDGAFVATRDTQPPDVDYDKLDLDDLQARADIRQLQVAGTGSGGRVLKADLVAALRAADQDAAVLDPKLIEAAAETVGRGEVRHNEQAVEPVAASATWATDLDNTAAAGSPTEESK